MFSVFFTSVHIMRDALYFLYIILCSGQVFNYSSNSDTHTVSKISVVTSSTLVKLKHWSILNFIIVLVKL